MRTEKEVMKQILAFAGGRGEVRAVVLNGSRVNPRLTPDEFADYDVVFVVDDPRAFKAERSWIGRFGETLIVQQNDSDEPGVEWVIFLMLFSDGVRIDLTFFPKACARLLYKDSLKKLLLDKDGLFPDFAAPDDSSYWIRRPTETEFHKTVNNFWWCLTNAARGIRRGELCYVKAMFDGIVRPELNRLLGWYIGLRGDWMVDAGYLGKWFQKYLPPDMWETVKESYAGNDDAEIWKSMFACGKLARRAGLELAEKLDYRYPLAEDGNVTAYLESLAAPSGAGYAP